MSYDEIASSYDSLYRSKRHRAEEWFLYRLISHHLDMCPWSKVLDIGCGTGSMLHHISLAPERYVGIDTSREMLNIAKSKFPQYSFINVDVSNYRDSFDVAVSNFGALNYANPESLRVWMNYITSRNVNYIFTVYSKYYRPYYHDSAFISYEVPNDLPKVNEIKKFSPVIPIMSDNLPESIWRTLMSSPIPFIPYRYKIISGG